MRLAPLNKQQIVGGLNRKENAAFNQIYDTYYALVYSLIDKFTNHSPETEDLTLGVFNKLLIRPKRFEQYKKIRDFLIQTAKNDSLKYLEKQREKKEFAEAVRMQPTWTEESGLEEAETTSLFHDLVTRAISKLPGQQRQVFTLYYEKSLSNPQIAEHMNISISTVANQKALALKTLKMDIRAKAKFLFTLIFCI